MTNAIYITIGLILVSITSFCIFHIKGKEFYFSVGEGLIGCQYLLKLIIYFLVVLGFVLIFLGFKENNNVTSS